MRRNSFGRWDKCFSRVFAAQKSRFRLGQSFPALPACGGVGRIFRFAIRTLHAQSYVLSVLPADLVKCRRFEPSGQYFKLLSSAILIYSQLRCCGFSANADFQDIQKQDEGRLFVGETNGRMDQYKFSGNCGMRADNASKYDSRYRSRKQRRADKAMRLRAFAETTFANRQREQIR